MRQKTVKKNRDILVDYPNNALDIAKHFKMGRPRRRIARLVKMGRMPLTSLPKHESINGTNTLDNKHGMAFNFDLLNKTIKPGKFIPTWLDKFFNRQP